MSKRKLEPEVTERIFGLIRAGNTLEVAAAAAGVHRATLHRWMKLGREQERGLYQRFLEEAEKAKAEAEARDVALIAKAATADWRAAAWRLERRSPRRYGQKVQISVQAEFDAAIDRLERGLTPEEFEKVLALLSAEDDDLPEALTDGVADA